MKILSILLTLTLLFPALSQSALAQTQWTGKCVHGYGTDSTGQAITDVATIQGIECLVANILATAITIIGIAAFVMFLVGSFRWLTAGANTKGVEGGRNALTFAVLGIVVALASWVILRFISDFTGVTTFLQFNTQIENIGP